MVNYLWRCYSTFLVEIDSISPVNPWRNYSTQSRASEIKLNNATLPLIITDLKFLENERSYGWPCVPTWCLWKAVSGARSEVANYVQQTRRNERGIVGRGTSFSAFFSSHSHNGKDTQEHLSRCRQSTTLACKRQNAMFERTVDISPLTKLGHSTIFADGCIEKEYGCIKSSS
ncbi:hypothetical protein MBANPS3_011855 [Mucor bainieri]